MSAPIKIWWCEHDQKATRLGWCRWDGVNPVSANHETCGPRLLVDPSALVVMKDEDDEWPLWAVQIMVDPTFTYLAWTTARQLLDALAAASKEETRAGKGSE